MRACMLIEVLYAHDDWAWRWLNRHSQRGPIPVPLPLQASDRDGYDPEAAWYPYTFRSRHLGVNFQK